MSRPNQDIKYAKVGNKDNPDALYDFIKPMRWLFGSTAPNNDIGENEWAYANTVTDDMYIKEDGLWVFKFNFSTGGTTGITDINNIGGGVRSYKPPLNGSVAEFRTISSDGSSGIIIEEDIPEPNTLNFSISPLYKPESLSLLNNFPFQTGLGSTSFNPNGNIGQADGYNLGSLVVQVPNIIWICQDPVAQAWIEYDASSGVSSCANVGGGGAVFRDTIDGVANFKTFQTTASIEAILNPDNFSFRVTSSFVPELLNKVANVFNDQDGKPNQPLGTDDASKGFQKGSLYIESEISGTQRLWTCISPTPLGSAQWSEFTIPTVPLTKDFIQFKNNTTPTQNVTGAGFQDMNLGSVADVVASSPTTAFTAVFDSTRLVFRRAVSLFPKAYKCHFQATCDDAVGAATTQDAVYIFRAIKKTGGITIPASITEMILPASPVNNRHGTYNTTFIIEEPDVNQQDYYFQLSGQRTGGGVQDYTMTSWNVSFEEMG